MVAVVWIRPCVALVVWYGGTQVLAGTLSAGLLISFLFQTLSVAMAFAFLSRYIVSPRLPRPSRLCLGSLISLGMGMATRVCSVYGDFMSAVGASERVFALIDRVPRIPISGGQHCREVVGHVVFEHVRFTYPSRDTLVLHDVSLELSPGKVLALVGTPALSGKYWETHGG